MKPKNNLDIRNTMAQRGITQSELAEVLHIQQPNVSKLLNKTPLSPAERARLMDGIDEVIRKR